MSDVNKIKSSSIDKYTKFSCVFVYEQFTFVFFSLSSKKFLCGICVFHTFLKEIPVWYFLGTRPSTSLIIRVRTLKKLRKQYATCMGGS